MLGSRLPRSSDATKLSPRVFVELGQVDEAEKKYQQCLPDDPNDTKAKRELDYVRSLQAKRKAQ